MRFIGLLAVFVGACTTPPRPAPANPATTLITNARIIDGSGAAARTGMVRISGDRIAEVGALRARAGERVIDAGGLALAPGFIDTHSHHDGRLFDMRDAIAAVSQGITTIVNVRASARAISRHTRAPTSARSSTSDGRSPATRVVSSRAFPAAIPFDWHPPCAIRLSVSEW